MSTMETIHHRLYDYIRAAGNQELRALTQLIEQELEQRSGEPPVVPHTAEESFSLVQLRQSLGQVQSKRLANWAPVPKDGQALYYPESIH